MFAWRQAISDEKPPNPRWQTSLSNGFVTLLLQIFIVLELITGGELFDKIVSEGR
jgi:hypothetical protein